MVTALFPTWGHLRLGDKALFPHPLEPVYNLMTFSCTQRTGTPTPKQAPGLLLFFQFLSLWKALKDATERTSHVKPCFPLILKGKKSNVKTSTQPAFTSRHFLPRFDCTLTTKLKHDKTTNQNKPKLPNRRRRQSPFLHPKLWAKTAATWQSPSSSLGTSWLMDAKVSSKTPVPGKSEGQDLCSQGNPTGRKDFLSSGPVTIHFLFVNVTHWT